MPLRQAEQMITDFHIKNRYTVGRRLFMEYAHGTKTTGLMLWLCAKILIFLSWLIKDKAIKAQKNSDCRLYRTWLMIEELSEVIWALYRGDEIEYADGLADLTYVVVGSNVTNDIPASEVFAEVHRSNMSKQSRKDCDPRMRIKGEGYTPPKIYDAICNGRNGVRISER